MGRRKIEMKKIEDKSSRQVTFSKRRSGLINKARQLSVLCAVDVGVIVFSSRGRLYEFFSPGSSSSSSSSLSQVLERYRHLAATEENASPKAEHMEQEICSRYSEIQTYAELVEIVERDLEGSNLEHLSVDDFMQLEEQLAVALAQTRYRKTQLMLEAMKTLEKKEKLFKLENEQLSEKLSNTEGSHHNRNQLCCSNKSHKGRADENHTDGTRRGADHSKEKLAGLEFEGLIGTHAGCPQPRKTLTLLP